MRKAVLIYNPVSGPRSGRRLAEVEAAAGVLHQAGIESDAIATTAAGSAGEQARQAVAAGCDTIVACGGDGTVHEVLQGLVGTEAALGVLPLGTGNSLANDLGLARGPARAARQLLAGETRRIAVGKVEYRDRVTGETGTRFFTVLAGIGADAQMLYEMQVELKQRHGMLAYYAQAARLVFTHKFIPFEVEFTPLSGAARRELVKQLMAVRIGQFGGLLRRIAPDAALERDYMQLVLFKTGNRLTYALYVLRAMLERRWKVPGVELVCATEAVCRHLRSAQSPKLYAEADGEVLGGLPVRVSMVANALTLLVPGRI